MGTKRVGLARIEALMENLKREIIGFNVRTTSTGNTTHADGSGDATLVRNTVNLINEDANATYTLPAASTCQRGDIIVVKYGVALTAGQKHAYGTSGEFFAAHSAVFKPATTPGVYARATAADGTADDFLNLTAVANAGPGPGTELVFHFDGTQWAVNGKIETTGTGGGTADVAFANS